MQPVSKGGKDARLSLPSSVSPPSTLAASSASESAAPKGAQASWPTGSATMQYLARTLQTDADAQSGGLSPQSAFTRKASLSRADEDAREALLL